MGVKPLTGVEWKNKLNITALHCKALFSGAATIIIRLLYNYLFDNQAFISFNLQQVQARF
jgi:hypothetical protein